MHTLLAYGHRYTKKYLDSPDEFSVAPVVMKSCWLLTLRRTGASSRIWHRQDKFLCYQVVYKRTVGNFPLSRLLDNSLEQLVMCLSIYSRSMFSQCKNAIRRTAQRQCYDNSWILCSWFYCDCEPFPCINISRYTYMHGLHFNVCMCFPLSHCHIYIYTGRRDLVKKITIYVFLYIMVVSLMSCR